MCRKKIVGRVGVNEYYYGALRFHGGYVLYYFLLFFVHLG